MTSSERLREDLAYVRSAVERQRRMLCEVISVGFAAVIGGYIVGVSLLKDLALQGTITGSVFNWSLWGGSAALIAVLLMRGYRHRRTRGEAERPHVGLMSQLRQSAPFLVLIAGLVFVDLYADAAGLEDAAVRPLVLAYISVGFMLIGFGGLRTLLWMGGGLAAGTLCYVLFGGEWQRTLVGLGFAGGLILGSWLERRSLRGPAAAS